MGKINCSIIKDLLPSYCDKMTSKATNKAVEEHLQECEKCKKVWREMNKDIETGNLDMRDEQVDYLKGFKKKKKFLAIISGVVTAVILLSVFAINVLNGNISWDEYKNVDVSKFDIKAMYIKDNVVYNYVEDHATGEEIYVGENSGFMTLEVYLSYTGDLEGMYLTGGSSGNNECFYKILAKELPKGVSFDDPGELKLSIPLGENPEYVYLTSLDGEVRELWNKDMPVLTEEEWQKSNSK